MSSILNDVKKFCNIDAADTAFDAELIIDINSVFMILKQIGVSDTSFSITDSDDEWSDYETLTDLEAVKNYVGFKVRLMFDPPTVGAVSDSINNILKELEWRISVQVDPGDEEDDDSTSTE